MGTSAWVFVGLLSVLATGSLMVFSYLPITYKVVASPVVTVGVYYETLCPHSIDFVVNQVFPTWLKLSPYMNLIMVPFGKANFTAKPEGGWNFTCQHGDDECFGNKVQSCALQHLDDEGNQLRFINCFMGAKYPPSAGPQCAESLGLSYNTIDTCSKGLEGEDLLHHYGVITKSLDPPLTFVPLVIFNGVFSMKDYNDARTDMPAVVCRYLSPPPEACNAI